MRGGALRAASVDNNKEFLQYCRQHAATPRCGFVPAQLARLCRLAGRKGWAKFWDEYPHQVLDCQEGEILKLVELAEGR